MPQDARGRGQTENDCPIGWLLAESSSARPLVAFSGRRGVAIRARGNREIKVVLEWMKSRTGRDERIDDVLSRSEKPTQVVRSEGRASCLPLLRTALTRVFSVTQVFPPEKQRRLRRREDLSAVWEQPAGCLRRLRPAGPRVPRHCVRVGSRRQGRHCVCLLRGDCQRLPCKSVAVCKCYATQQRKTSSLEGVERRTWVRELSNGVSRRARLRRRCLRRKKDLTGM